MRLYIDSANVEQICHLNEYYPIAGVTTNPSILVKENRPFLEVLKEIREVIGEEKELFVQLIGETAEEMIEEANFLMRELTGKVAVKIPVTEEGLKAIKILSAANIPVLATTIYTSFQALMAALAGAKYVAPYVNRIDNLTGNGVKVVSEIAQFFESYKLSTEILAASFKNVQQIHDVCLAGAETVTVSPDLIEKFIAFPATASDVTVFKTEWQKAYGTDLIYS
ncbi:fructose-6-phosphate aldolase [Bacillus sp. ISL-47]|uniref:transaldolase family protein n=1 Tax=Bacillus sp. ISL-47 TaxID=2819130 RepID=UPI001BEC518D|nr:transaldolase family protein [Bacillus sp. ISL-47]MBT2690971.1 fructose-6-phosphate aldolase [Bacillus sp. ISL-47]MBT2706749.1 fructose-6-phosphate aldolase [Pseudomonas sp. ISL-84]